MTTTPTTPTTMTTTPTTLGARVDAYHRREAASADSLATGLPVRYLDLRGVAARLGLTHDRVRRPNVRATLPPADAVVGSDGGRDTHGWLPATIDAWATTPAGVEATTTHTTPTGCSSCGLRAGHDRRCPVWMATEARAASSGATTHTTPTGAGAA